MSSGEAIQGGKFLTFSINEQRYGIRLFHIKEIIEAREKITVVPEFPAYGKGIINLRGDIIPIIDLRLRFHLPEKPYDNQTCIVIAFSGDPTEASYVGFIVDRVYDVCDIETEDLSPAPEIASGSSKSYFSAVGKSNGNIVMILDSSVLLTEDMKKAVEAFTEE
ncbi:MAG: chemotaxis protein CheW [Huintestinicola sp.]